MDSNVLAIDIGASSVKAASGHADETGLVVDAKAIAPTAGYGRGAFNDYAAVAESVTKVLARLNIDSSAQQVVVGIGQLVSDSAETMAVPLHTATALAEALAVCNVEASAIISSAAAGFSYMLDSLPAGDCLLIDIGAGSADYALRLGKQLTGLSTVHVGGGDITAALMRRLAVGFLHAEEIKRYYVRLGDSIKEPDTVLDCNDFGTDDKMVPYRELTQIINSQADKLAAQITAALLAAQLPLPNMKVAYITGGCAGVTSLRQALADRLGVQLCVYKPSLPGYDDSLYTDCLGILAYGLKQKMQYNAAAVHSGEMEIPMTKDQKNIGFFARIKKCFNNS